MARMASDASGRNVGIVAHAGVIRVFICHCLQMPLANLFRIRLDYGSLSIVDYGEDCIEVCALNVKPSNFIGFGDIEIRRFA
jgi:broad specificity phosphatase PhoE